MTYTDTAVSGVAYSSATGVQNATGSCSETVTTYPNKVTTTAKNTYNFNCYILNVGS